MINMSNSLTYHTKRVRLLAILMLLASPTYSQTTHLPTEPYNAYDLLSHSSQVRGKMIALKVAIKCRSADLCWTETSEGLTIAINPSRLTSGQKHRLGEQCYYRTCNQLLIGKPTCSQFDVYGMDDISPAPVVAAHLDDELWYETSYEYYVKEVTSTR